MALALSVVSTLSIATLAMLAVISQLRDNGSSAGGHILGDGRQLRYCVAVGRRHVACVDDVRAAFDLRRDTPGSHILDTKSGVRFAGAQRGLGAARRATGGIYDVPVRCGNGRRAIVSADEMSSASARRYAASWMANEEDCAEPITVGRPRLVKFIMKWDPHEAS